MVFVALAPLARIKQAMDSLQKETQQMDIRIGVLQHVLLRARLKEKHRIASGKAPAVRLDADDDDIGRGLRGY
jgi:estrogen-related receptor beta like 1